MTINLAELRRLAEAATPGPWRTGSGSHWSREVRYDDAKVVRAIAWCGSGDEQMAHLNAAFISAACPATVLALLDRLEAAEARCAALDEAVMRINAEHLDDVQRLTRERDEAEPRTAERIAAWLEDRGDSCNPVNSARLIRDGMWRDGGQK